MVTAALGPTNTGKTHRAILRMQEHESGIIGLPLRLLAREVYDKLVRARGPDEVALITGEEKRVPPRPRYWVSTVEAMPKDLVVDFVAIDEVQLAAHPERGHVFSERILEARGRKETWLLGSDAVEPLLRRLVPDLEVTRLPRMSTLTFRGSHSLAELPRRSALVAFSARRVYELALRLKAKRGGVAIVLGALSPRARNAQVAMYQAGEVDFLVATDAIGMGLNLDIDHVTFADTLKFDGKERRPLDVSELAQIAGRAGRHLRDGTFGVLSPAMLPFPLSKSIEEHRFPALERLVWRSSALDFSSVEALLTSLSRSPPSPLLEQVRDAEDSHCLRLLAADPLIRERATTESRVRLLWDLCQVPDYRQILPEQHARLMSELYVRLVDEGRLSATYLERRIENLARHQADIDDITAKIAFCRTWTYVTNHDEWVEDARGFQARTRQIEDELSDALHAALVESFVDPRQRKGRHAPATSSASPKGRSDYVAALASLAAQFRGAEAPLPRTPGEQLMHAAPSALTITQSGHVSLSGDGAELVVGQLTPGQKPGAPRTRLLLSAEAGLDPTRLGNRLESLVREHTTKKFNFTARLEAVWKTPLPSAVRGIGYQLDRGLGATLESDARSLVGALLDEERAYLERLGVVFGRHSVYQKPLLKKRALELRRTLLRVHHGHPVIPNDVALERVAFDLDGPPHGELVAGGFAPLGPKAVRLDVVERLVDALELPPNEGAEMAARLVGTKTKVAIRILRALAGARRQDPPTAALARPPALP